MIWGLRKVNNSIWGKKTIIWSTIIFFSPSHILWPDLNEAWKLEVGTGRERAPGESLNSSMSSRNGNTWYWEKFISLYFSPSLFCHSQDPISPAMVVAAMDAIGPWENLPFWLVELCYQEGRVSFYDFFFSVLLLLILNIEQLQNGTIERGNWSPRFVKLFMNSQIYI